MSQDLHPTPQAEQELAGTAQAPTPPAGGSSNGLALTALILGIVAVLFAFIPFFGAVVALPVGLTAVVLGLIGKAKAKHVGGAGFAVAGMVTGGVAILVALLWGVLAGLFFTTVEGDLTDAIEDITIPFEGVTAPEAGVAWTEAIEPGAFWYAGLRFEMAEAELAADEFGQSAVTLRGTVENLTDGTVDFLDVGAFWLGWAGELIAADWSSSIEAVPAGGVNRVALAFPVGEDFVLDEATLFAGSPAQQQAVVPLGTTGELVDLAPVDLGITGSAEAAGLQLEVTAAELRGYDSDYRQLDAGQLALIFAVDLTNNSEGAASPVSYDFRLDLPDGRTAVADLGVGARPWEHLFRGDSIRDEPLVFMIDEPVSGDYVLIIEFEGEQGSLEFSL